MHDDREPGAVEDLHATMYHALGIPPDTSFVVEKRPVYVTQGRQGQAPIRGSVCDLNLEDSAMKRTRREFLAAAAAAAAPRSCSACRTRRARKRRCSAAGAFTYEAIHDWGELPPRIKWGNTHGVVEDSQGQHLRSSHRARDQRQRRHDGRLRSARASSCGRGASEFRGVAHGLHIRKEGSDEFLYLTVNAANPKMTPQPALQAVVVKTTLKGEIVWKIAGTAAISKPTRPGADGAPKRYNPTNIAIAPNGDVYVGDGYGSYYVNQYNSKGEYIRTFGGKGSEAGQLNEPHGIWVDTRGGTPILVVADRRNNRLQRFTLDGKHIDFVPGFRLPCHFDERQGVVVIPDLHGRVTLIDRRTTSHRAPGRFERGELEQPAAHAAARRSSSPDSSSARTAPASITTATSSSSSGSRSDESPNYGRCEPVAAGTASFSVIVSNTIKMPMITVM